MCLQEIKTTHAFSLPGFRCLRSKIIAGEELRGGVAVLFKHATWNEMYSAKLEHDQVWFKLTSCPEFIFGAVYIPPADSPFHTPALLAKIHELTVQKDTKAVIIGDFNARMNCLQAFDSPSQGIKYSSNINSGSNSNGTQLSDLCRQCGLFPINHLEVAGRNFRGNWTYKQGQTWKSQIDWALVSHDGLCNILNFEILHDLKIPTDHAPLLLKMGNFQISPSHILQRALQLDESFCNTLETRKRCPMESLNMETFTRALDSITWHHFTDTSDFAAKIADKLYEAALSASESHPNNEQPTTRQTFNGADDRWNHVMQLGDPRRVWSAINWNGTFDTPNDVTEMPTDSEFCDHYRKLLNEYDNEILSFQPSYFKYVPILDDEISPMEVEQAIKTLKSNKAPGIDGVPPGTLKWLNDDWLFMITYLFNRVFTGQYPKCWSLARMVNIFKKGSRIDCNNYRGISILQALAKLYDLVLSRRFILWYKPRDQQAGAQKGRGCEEQILCLRLLIDIARRKKLSLYVTFVDFQKAYDKVDRGKLLNYLDGLGCGTRFLEAIKASLAEASGLVGQETFQTTNGVRQGASTSCPLFTCFIDPLISAIEELGPDSWLDDIHCLLLMDDTALLASSRATMQQKLQTLVQKTQELGIVINQAKTKFICTGNDFRSFEVGELSISKVDKYTYLGTPISIASITDQVRNHISEKNGHVLKLTSFLAKNTDAPWKVKYKVWDSAFKSAVFYSCQTWLTDNLQAANTIFNQTLKQVLGVRRTTCNDLIYVEMGCGDAKSHIRELQRSFLQKVQSRENFNGSYIAKIMKMAKDSRCPAALVLQTLLSEDAPHSFIAESQEKLKSKIMEGAAMSIRRETYMSLIPELSKHPMYDTLVPESHRLATTCIRLQSHH